MDHVQSAISEGVKTLFTEAEQEHGIPTEIMECWRHLQIIIVATGHANAKLMVHIGIIEDTREVKLIMDLSSTVYILDSLLAETLDNPAVNGSDLWERAKTIIPNAAAEFIGRNVAAAMGANDDTAH